MAPRVPKQPPPPAPPPDRAAAEEALRKKKEADILAGNLDRSTRGRSSTVVSSSLLGLSEPATASKTLLGG